MSCLQDQTLWCEAKLRAEHSNFLGSSIGVILLWARSLVVGVTGPLYGQWILAWSSVCKKLPPPSQQFLKIAILIPAENVGNKNGRTRSHSWVTIGRLFIYQCICLGTECITLASTLRCRCSSSAALIQQLQQGGSSKKGEKGVGMKRWCQLEN